LKIPKLLHICEYADLLSYICKFALVCIALSRTVVEKGVFSQSPIAVFFFYRCMVSLVYRATGVELWFLLGFRKIYIAIIKNGINYKQIITIVVFTVNKLALSGDYAYYIKEPRKGNRRP